MTAQTTVTRCHSSHAPQGLRQTPSHASQGGESRVCSIARFLQLCLVIQAIGLLSGCLASSRRLAYTDPPSLSPYSRSLTDPSPDGSGQPYTAARPTPAETPQPTLADPDSARGSTGSRPEAPAFPRETQKPSTGPSAADTPETAPAEESESFMLPAIPPPPQVGLTVSAPAQQRLGQNFVCGLTVVNTGQVALEELSIECALDEGLSLPGRSDRRVQSQLKSLAPGATQDLRITLVGREPGKLCCVFILRSGAEVAAQREHCLEIVDNSPDSLDVEVSAPPARTIGSRAEFNIHVANRGSTALENLMVDVTYSDCIRARRASNGVQQHTGRLAWRVPKLDAGQVVVFQAEFTCERISDQCPLSISASADGSERVREEVLLQIIPVPGNLDVQLTDDVDPVSVGGEAWLEARVQNLGLQMLNNVLVTLTIPENCRILAATVQQQGHDHQLRFELDGQDVVFERVPQLPPNTVLNFRVHVKALRAGNVTCQVQTVHAQREEPLVLREPLTITP